MLFIVNIDTSILTTTVGAITNDIGGFDMASWVLSSYMLGYVGKAPISSPGIRL